MRIAQVCPYGLSVPGGVQGQALGLARALRALGHETRVLGPCDGPPPELGVIPLGNCIPTPANGSVAPISPDLSCTLRTMRALRDEDFDVVHLHEPLAPGPTMTTLVVSPKPMVGTFHAAGASAAYRWLRPLTCWMAGRLTIRCAVSEDARRLARKALGGDYVALHNGVDVEAFAKATPWPTTGPTILFASRHEARKGLSVLLAALAWLPRDAHIWVASEGPQTEQLKDEYADPRIEWLGTISDEEKARRLRGADVMCAPSLHGESFGMVLLEAMAAGTPVVASDIPGYRNVARSGQEALLVPPGEARPLAVAVTRLFDDATLAEELAEAGEARAAHFSMDRLAERYLELYAAAQRMTATFPSPA